MTINPTSLTIRSRKLGVLIRDVRVQSDSDIGECAMAIGVPSETLEAYEFGEQAPSLPELELLAYYLQVPLERFIEGKAVVEEDQPRKQLDAGKIIGLRQKVIGAMIRKKRMDADLSIDEFAEEIGLPVEKITSYEYGETAIPLPELEVIATALNLPVSEFQDRHGPAGAWLVQRRASRDFCELPLELQIFVCKPVNRPYLEMAQRLSEMSVEKLRIFAESLLEITL